MMLDSITFWFRGVLLHRRARKAVFDSFESGKVHRLVHTAELSVHGLDELEIYDRAGRMLEIEVVYPGFSMWDIASAMTDLSKSRIVKRDFREVSNPLSRAPTFQEELTRVG